MTPVRAAVRRLSPSAPVVPASPSQGDHLRVVEPVREVDLRRRTAIRTGVSRRGPAVSALVFVGLLALAACHTMLVQGQIALDSIEEAVAVQQEEYQKARLEVARLESPDRIVEQAITRLGMVQPADVVYLTPGEAVIGEYPPSRDETDEAWLEIKPYLERNP